MAHDFLSDPWMDAVEALKGEAPEPAPALKNLVLNITVVDGPDGARDVHLSDGQFERGHADGAATRLTVPFDVAKELFIDGNPQAAMTAFMSGRIKVEGDISKVMAMQAGGPPSPEQQAFQEKLKAITA